MARPDVGEASPDENGGATGEGGGPGSGTEGGDGVLSGVFVDSPVAGLSWETATRNGVTGRDGGFEYLPGETITFSIGELRFEAAAAADRRGAADGGERQGRRRGGGRAAEGHPHPARVWGARRAAAQPSNAQAPPRGPRGRR